jgi:putative nucleotidyltransferase with HDIG domain
MTVPSREQAAAVLLDLRPGPRLLRHMTAVGEISAFLAARMAARGVPIDRRLVETAALLHDLDKALPRADPLRALGHGYAGAKWLTDHGFAELAAPVAQHPVSRLGEDALYASFLEEATWEVRVVAYADKRAAQRLAPIGERFRRWKGRHPELSESLTQACKRAELLEAEVCEQAGVTPEEVQRLRWVVAATDRARKAREAA